MKHKIITFGELMLRLSPDNNERFTQAHSYEAVYGGGEANTAVSLANFNVDTRYVTKLPKHTIGQSAVNSLRQYGVDVSTILSAESSVVATRLAYIFLRKRQASDQPMLYIIEMVPHSPLLQRKILTGILYSMVQHGSIFLV